MFIKRDTFITALTCFIDLQSEEADDLHLKAQRGRTYKSSVSYRENEVKERLQAGLQGRRGLLDLERSNKQTHCSGDLVI